MTSSAVVGSSAMTSRGEQASAAGDQQPLALAARELVRIALQRASGSGTCMRRKSSTSRSTCRRRRSAPLAPSSGACQRMTSRSWLPTLNTGLRARRGPAG